MAQPSTRSVTFGGDLLQRGFWLYVWEVTTPERDAFYYVGRTGDSSSLNAQSPYNRMGQHLGFNENTNQVRRHLKRFDVTPEQCWFSFVAHGPIMAEEKTMELYRQSRDVAAGLEKALADAMEVSGYKVLNIIKCRKPVNEKMFADVRAAFAEHFPALRILDAAAATTSESS